MHLGQRLDAIAQLSGAQHTHVLRLPAVVRCLGLGGCVHHHVVDVLGNAFEVEVHQSHDHVETVDGGALHQIAEHAQHHGHCRERGRRLHVDVARIEQAERAAHGEKTAAEEVDGHLDDGPHEIVAGDDLMAAIDAGQQVTAGVQLGGQRSMIDEVHEQRDGDGHVATDDEQAMHGGAVEQRGFVVLDVEDDVEGGDAGGIDEMGFGGFEAHRAPIERVGCIAAELDDGEHDHGGRLEDGVVVVGHCAGRESERGIAPKCREHCPFYRETIMASGRLRSRSYRK